MTARSYFSKAQQHLMIYAIASFIVLIDHITKQIALVNLKIGAIHPLINGLLEISLTFNKGIAFGMIASLSMAITVFVAVLIVGSIWYIPWIPKKYMVGAALILGGAAGNLLDRILYGYVIDFIRVPFFSVFNAADICVTCGVCVLLIQMWLERNSAVSTDRTTRSSKN